MLIKKGELTMKYILRRIITLFITLIIVSLVTFLAFNVLPGDPVSIILGTDSSPQKVEALREELGLNQSLPQRYANWTINFLKGDMGKSTRFSEPVKSMISDRLPITVWLSGLAIFFIFLIAIPLGIYSAKKEGSFIDTIINVICQINIAIPNFFLGIILMYIFGIVFKIFSIGNYIDYKQSFTGFIGYLILPALAIALPKIAIVVKFLRTSVLEQLGQDYVRTAYSKGNGDNAVLYVHVLKNSIITVITLMGMIIADVLAGSIIIEQLFALPGIGSLLITSISARDFPLTQAMVVYMAFIVVFVNFLVDVLYQVIDPRIRVK
jgi:peptide/nickel transport system permease protein